MKNIKSEENKSSQHVHQATPRPKKRKYAKLEKETGHRPKACRNLLFSAEAPLSTRFVAVPTSLEVDVQDDKDGRYFTRNTYLQKSQELKGLLFIPKPSHAIIDKDVKGSAALQFMQDSDPQSAEEIRQAARVVNQYKLRITQEITGNLLKGYEEKPRKKRCTVHTDVSSAMPSIVGK